MRKIFIISAFLIIIALVAYFIFTSVRDKKDVKINLIYLNVEKSDLDTDGLIEDLSNRLSEKDPEKLQININTSVDANGKFARTIYKPKGIVSENILSDSVKSILENFPRDRFSNNLTNKDINTQLNSIVTQLTNSDKSNYYHLTYVIGRFPDCYDEKALADAKSIFKGKIDSTLEHKIIFKIKTNKDDLESSLITYLENVLGDSFEKKSEDIAKRECINEEFPYIDLVVLSSHKVEEIEPLLKYVRKTFPEGAFLRVTSYLGNKDYKLYSNMELANAIRTELEISKDMSFVESRSLMVQSTNNIINNDAIKNNRVVLWSGHLNSPTAFEIRKFGKMGGLLINKDQLEALSKIRNFEIQLNLYGKVKGQDIQKHALAMGKKNIRVKEAR